MRLRQAIAPVDIYDSFSGRAAQERIRPLGRLAPLLISFILVLAACGDDSAPH